MTIKPSLYWNDKIVMSFLIQAADIHRRLPDIRRPGYYHSLWPHAMLIEEANHLCEIIHGKSTLGPPMPPEVTFQDEILEWLSWLDKKQRQITWMRSNQIPWKIMEEDFGRSKSTLWRELHRCLQILISHLNRKDPKGEYFKRLRSRTLCYL